MVIKTENFYQIDVNEYYICMYNKTMRKMFLLMEKNNIILNYIYSNVHFSEDNKIKHVYLNEIESLT